MPPRRKPAGRLPAPFLKRLAFLEERAEPGVFPFTLPYARRGFELSFDAAVTFFVGANGTGKSTLLEAIAAQCGLSPEGGSRDHFLGAADEPEARLADALRLSWLPKVRGFFFRAETFYNLAGFLDAASPGADAGRALHALSHGESYLAFLESRLARDDALFLMDEPESALSPEAQLELLSLVEARRRTGRVQFLIATHSPILVALPRSRILLFDHRGIRPTILDDVPHLRWYREFLRDPEAHVAAHLAGGEAEETE
jgi:predicted ATPase